MNRAPKIAPQRAWVAVGRPFVATRHAVDCHYCGGEGRVVSPHQATCEDGSPDTDVCPACRGSKVLEWCEQCLAATDSYELGDECRATRTIEVRVDQHHAARRLCCDSDECAAAAIDAARTEATKAADYRAALRAANAQTTCRHGDVPFACGKCDAEFEATLVQRELVALEAVRNREAG